ncbi:UNVERIFIED_CONTAM: Pentatricopeptide repeat-containing protein, mitochondrial [Sesamum calycinum]|uniref:Pentatricopeptide repeat-containing protein, mitochondrial n=1 Tax=Sesamum calycinum TaxID=2727403 RepID=A0AAW2QYV2_9LAMI
MISNRGEFSFDVSPEMLQTGKEYKESLPDDESYDLVIGMLLSTNQIDSALNNVRLDTLVSIIERCKKTDQNKSLCPDWRVCNYIADVAMQSDNSELNYYALEFIAKWIARGEAAKPPVLLSVDEGLVISALGTAGRTYNSKLLDGSWAVLKRSLRQKKVPNPESYLGKIYAHANLGNLQKAFSTLHEFETAHGNSNQEDGEDLFSPFHTLNPLVTACSKNGFVTLDSVYYQLENLSQGDVPYKSVAALNCRDEAVKVFEHFVALGVKPNATTYSLLIDAHLIKRDPKAALSVIDEMTVQNSNRNRNSPRSTVQSSIHHRLRMMVDLRCAEDVSCQVFSISLPLALCGASPFVKEN